MSTIYGVSELAAAAGISPDAIRQRCQRGTIPEPTAVLANGRVWQGEEDRGLDQEAPSEGGAGMRYEDMTEAEQDKAQTWQQAHRDLTYDELVQFERDRIASLLGRGIDPSDIVSHSRPEHRPLVTDLLSET